MKFSFVPAPLKYKIWKKLADEILTQRWLSMNEILQNPLIVGEKFRRISVNFRVKNRFCSTFDPRYARKIPFVKTFYILRRRVPPVSHALTDFRFAKRNAIDKRESAAFANALVISEFHCIGTE